MKHLVIAAVLTCFLAAGYGCANKAQQGATVGGLAGATIGALTFKDKLLGAAVGAGVGVLMGYIVGNEWDKHDEAKLQKTLETNNPGRPPHGRIRILARPTPPLPVVLTWPKTRSTGTSSSEMPRTATKSWPRPGAMTRESGT